MVGFAPGQTAAQSTGMPIKTQALLPLDPPHLWVTCNRRFEQTSEPPKHRKPFRAASAIRAKFLSRQRTKW